MVNYPVDFEAKAEASQDSDDWSLATLEGLETEMSTPEDFGGDSENPSPEDLFNASLSSCILATFKITAERKDLDYQKITVNSKTSLDRNEDGRPVMKSAELQVEVKGVSDIELAKEVARITEKNCFIHNAVKTDVNTDFEYTE